MKNSKTLNGRLQPTPPPRRLAFIDALRGVAVLLMIAQHVSLWLCATSRGSLFILIAGALGGLAAPIFVTLSGVSITLLSNRRQRPDILLVARGAMILGFGYVLNLLTPHWFSPGSWYILHLIGAVLITAPLLRRLSDTGLTLMLVGVLIVTGVLQNHLNLPLRQFNMQMAAPVGLAGVARYALAGGFFPIFPWIAFSITGILAGRWLMDNRLDKALRLALGFLLIMAVLAATYAIGPDFARFGPMVRYFKLQESFFSALTPLSLFLMAVSVFFIIGFFRIDQKHPFDQSHILAHILAHILVCLGRASLTILMVHIVVIRESAFYFGYWKTFSQTGGLFTTLAILAGFAWAAKVWQLYQYKYGFEWLLRAVYK